MKRLLLISLTAILGIGSMANMAIAHPDHHGDRDGYHNSYEDNEDSEAPKPAEPLRYRTQLREEPAETEEPEVHHGRRWQRVDRYDENNYRRERRRQMRHRRYYNNGTRYDPGRY
jgi:hypothetical protein